MTEKTEYITASIELLEKRDELNSDELAVLCNLKKFMNNDRQPAFAVGEYYVSNDGDIYKIALKENLLITVKLYSISSGRFLDMTIPSHDPQDKTATAEQVAEFKRAEHFASKGRKLDEFRVGDRVNCSEIPFDNGYYMGDLKIERFVGKQFVAESETSFYPFNLDEINKVTLIQTAEELQEVENNE